VPEHASLNQYAQAYVNQSDTSLDKIELMKTYERITQ